MTTFSDDFNRADGALGNGWTSQGFGPYISAQHVITQLSRLAYRFPFTSPPVQRARINSHMAAALSATACPIVCWNTTATSCYAGSVYWTGTRYNWAIYKRVGTGPTLLASGNHAGTLIDPLAVELVYDAGTLTLLAGGVVFGTVADNSLDGQNGVGMWVQAPTGWCDDFYCDDLAAYTLDVTPEPIVQMAEPQALEFIGIGTSWTPGTPGDPIFTVDKGEITDQVIDSATHGTGTYTPPQADDTASFTDPSTGESDAVALSTGFQVQPPADFSEEAVAYIEASATQNSGDPGVILSTKTPITPYGTGIALDLINARLYAWVNTMAGDVPQNPPSEGLLFKLWRILNGGDEPDIDDNVFDAAMSAWAAAVNAENGITAIRTVNALTLQDILDALPADVSAALAAIQADLDSIRTIQGYTLGSVLDYLTYLYGGILTDTSNAAGLAAAMRTAFNWHLGDVKNWTEAVRGEGLPTIADVLDAIAGELNVDLQPVLDAIAAVRGADSVDLTQLHDQTGQLAIDTAGHFGHVDTAISGVRGMDARDLTEVFDAIAALPQTQVDLSPVLTAVANLSTQLTNTRSDILAAIAGIRPADYPLWPGEASVTLGDPVQGTGNFTVPGPCDGVVMTIDAAPRDILKWSSGGIDSYAWAGYLAFVSDRGDAEAFQFVNLSRRVAVPLHMLQADSVVIHLRAGVQATVTPWTVDV